MRRLQPGEAVVTMQRVATGERYTVRLGPRLGSTKSAPILARPTNSRGQHFREWAETVARSRNGYARNPKNLVGNR